MDNPEAMRVRSNAQASLLEPSASLIRLIIISSLQRRRRHRGGEGVSISLPVLRAELTGLKSRTDRETWYIIYMYMYIHTYIVCFEGGKKAQNFSPPAAGETPDP